MLLHVMLQHTPIVLMGVYFKVKSIYIKIHLLRAIGVESMW